MKKNILIVDDSALMRRFISDIIEKDDRFVVKDVARNGLEALEMIEASGDSYDAIILDINMPKMDGVELLCQLQKRRIKTRTIVVSTYAKEGGKETILALENGALDVVKKPENYAEVKGESFRTKIISSLCMACKIAVETKQDDTNIQKKVKHHKNSAKVKGKSSKLIAIACSTGGPKSLKEVIPKLPKNLDASVIIVQHMPPGFTYSLAERLNDISDINVKEAEHGEQIKKGWVYLAPGGKHIRVSFEADNHHYIRLSDEDAIDGLKPCANIMYESLCDSRYDKIVCTVLTGMGADGTKGINALKEKKKNIYVIAQDEKTSVVYGMPRAVALAGMTDEILPLSQVADAITKNTGVLDDGR